MGREEGGSDRGTNSDSRTGLTREMEKVGLIFREAGNWKHTAVMFTMQSISKGPTNLGNSFLDSTQSGRSFENGQTFWPAQNKSAGIL